MRTTVEQIKRKAQALERLEALVQQIAESQLKRDAMIAELYKDRVASAREIGDVAGLSRNRVMQIAKSIELKD